jgi:hypothetical protein
MTDSEPFATAVIRKDLSVSRFVLVMVFIHRLFQLIASGLINRRQPMRDFGRKGAIELGATNRIGRPVGNATVVAEWSFQRHRLGWLARFREPGPTDR